jgi:hypothetical protein
MELYNVHAFKATDSFGQDLADGNWIYIHSYRKDNTYYKFFS